MPNRTLVVVDDFYPDPDAVREHALSLAYPITGRFPGRNSANDDVETEMRRVSQVLGASIVINARSRDVTFFRLTRGSDRGSCDIHVDGSRWAGVCYLNPPDQCFGGTSFFRHRRSGLTRWPTDEQIDRMRADGLLKRSPQETDRELSAFFVEEGKDRSKWELVYEIPMVYNRAIFYDANQFHSIAAWDRFGETPEAARLTRLFFFDIKE